MENPTHDSPPAPSASPATPLETLAAYAEAAKAHRLAPADEENAITLLVAQLKGGKAGITAAVEPMLALPWMISVSAISTVWSELSLVMQRFLIASIAKVDTEQARRLRMSIARAVFKIDPAAGTRLAVGIATDLRNPETGNLSTRSRQLFFHVLVGKGKPWLCQLSLEGVKGADALVSAVLEVLPLAPPLSQLSILRWIHASGRFKKLSEPAITEISRCVGRWNYRLQQALKADIPDLPEAITAVLKPERSEPPAQKEAKETKDAKPAPPESAAEPSADGEAAVEAEAAAATTEDEAEAATPVESTGASQSASQSGPPDRVPTRRERDAARKREEEARREERAIARREDRKRREAAAAAAAAAGEEPSSAVTVESSRSPALESRSSRRSFDLRTTLREVETYVAGLRQELDQAKTQLRRREDRRDDEGSRRARREEPRQVDVEGLLRHNAQLEATVEALKHQLEDLASDHEAVAESRRLHGDEPLPEGSSEQLRSLLSIKLHESYETYLAMRQDPLDRVFRLDYRDLLGSVFDVLQNAGVSLNSP